MYIIYDDEGNKYVIIKIKQGKLYVKKNGNLLIIPIIPNIPNIPIQKKEKAKFSKFESDFICEFGNSLHESSNLQHIDIPWIITYYLYVHPNVCPAIQENRKYLQENREIRTYTKIKDKYNNDKDKMTCDWQIKQFVKICIDNFLAEELKLDTILEDMKGKYGERTPIPIQSNTPIYHQAYENHSENSFGTNPDNGYQSYQGNINNTNQQLQLHSPSSISGNSMVSPQQEHINDYSQPLSSENSSTTNSLDIQQMNKSGIIGDYYHREFDIRPVKTTDEQLPF